ncbi:hypothetical protein [Kutzneria sp. CA-103260]|nr:hypothetical protein [Kutzneria sp. CA-103260]QUQ64307.1 hypothetical protein JJ691_20270 [Kutzneria sp. CA-103260]
MSRRSLVSPALYLVTALVALVNAPASLALDATTAIYFALLPGSVPRA